MEGVGARLGRSSTRYGPATVFSGPVRKWKKRWVHVSPSNHNSNGGNNNNNSSNHNNNNNHSHISTNGSANGTSSSSSNGNNGSHLLLYKWTPSSQTNSGNNNNNGNAANHSNGDKTPVKDDDAAQHEPPRRKFKYIPVDLLEKQKQEAAEKEAAEKADDEAKLSDADQVVMETVLKADGFDEKPDINDTPMEESQDDEQGVRQDLNESTLDLSLGLKSHDGDSDSKPDKSKDGQLERVNSTNVGT